MLLERIVSEGLAHYSYIIGDKNDALVIDPRRDSDVYEEKAKEAGMRIRYILETHRNEDFFIGSMELSNRTGAKVWHADGELKYKYGNPVNAGQRWKVGRLELEAIPTPGHTPGSMSYLLRDPTGLPWIVFCGDALFAGEVGRIDLLGSDMAPKLANLLYESLFERLIPLGDEVIICPAHGSGSVCGELIAERVWSTIGIERKNNPRLLAKSKDDFVFDLVRSQPERPPYFRKMEKVNLDGDPILGALPPLRPLAPKDFQSMAPGYQILDTRMELEFGAAHVPGSKSIWIDGLASFAGWFLDYDKPILLVTQKNDAERCIRILVRLGFDDIAGYLAGGMLNWHMSGLESKSIRTISVQDLCRRLDDDYPTWILDVRSEEELKKDGKITGSQDIHLTKIPARMNEVPKDKSVFVFCGSGLRSMIAASLLQNAGWTDLTVILGGFAGWRSSKCRIE